MGKLLARLLRITSFFQYFISKIEINKWSRFEKVYTPALEASALRFSGLMTEEVRPRKEFIAWQRHVTWQWERLWTLKWRKTSANSIKHRFRDIFCLLISNYRWGISDGKSKRFFFLFFFFSRKIYITDIVRLASVSFDTAKGSYGVYCEVRFYYSRLLGSVARSSYLSS